MRAAHYDGAGRDHRPHRFGAARPVDPGRRGVFASSCPRLPREVFMSPSPHPAFARRTGGLHSSAIRDLLTITARPEIVSLAGGLPDPELIPRMRIREASEAVLARPDAVQYTETAGWFGLREVI